MPNREQRRHPEKFEKPEQNPPIESVPPKVTDLERDDRTQDDFSVRAKSTGHGKKTADKWNQ